TDDYEWEDLTTGAYCAYYNDESYVNTYGYLYNGFAVDSNKIALPGWRVPNDEDVHELITFLITTPPKVDFSEVQGTNAGGKLKDSGYDYWWDPNKGATNEYGFSALPGGYRYVDIYSKHSSFWEMSKIASFWNLLHWYDPNKASVGYINLHFDRSDILRVITGDKHIGRSVRLVKED
ncbi:MAG: FISUMP domain-containing protein, partial [bacterium]